LSADGQRRDGGPARDGERHLGLFGATAIGVGAIVGGGILALAGVAFRTAGPGALVAFALNGGIAFLTAASFSELAVRFPQSGGAYTYAKRVLSIEVAFVVGWVVWFASIVAGVLYAIGFAVFAAEGLVSLAQVFGRDAAWLARGELRIVFALLATGWYTLALIRSAGGGGVGPTVGKLVVFVVLIAGGAVAAFTTKTSIADPLDPFLPYGSFGVIEAMGYTFIALQGFDLIAAVGGEVKDPTRNIPRAMYLSLAIALVIYLPLLFLIASVGVPADGSVTEAAAANPEGLVAEAAGRFLGPAGYWLVIGAGVLSMLSALQANLLGASRVAFAMARDRTLPRPLGRMRGRSATPALAVIVTAGLLAIVVLAIGDVSAAGAASSLIFLISFALVHWAAILARRRSGDLRLPVLPLVGAALCIALATFQAVAVPPAGILVVALLMLGVAVYLTVLAPGASLADATAQARDPELARQRGRSPLVLVPIANPASAASLVGVAATVRTPGTGRVMLLSIVPALESALEEDQPALRDAERILGESLYRSFERETPTETLFTVASDPLLEIARVVGLHRCETVVLGAPRADVEGASGRLEALITQLDVDVAMLRATWRWRVAGVRRVLVPLGGLGHHSRLRARMLASLNRNDDCEITFLRSVPPDATPAERRKAEREVRARASDEAEGHFEVVIETEADPVAAIVRHAAEADLIVMGFQHGPDMRSLFGPFIREVMDRCEAPLILLGSRRPRSLGGLR
jgi:amino acid transporter